MALHQISQTEESAIKAENTSTGAGVWSNAQTGTSIVGQSIDGRGILGESTTAQGVWGVSHAKFHGGVTGVNDNQSQEAGPGVFGTSKGTGIWGESETWNGVFGTTKSTTGGAGVHGRNDKGAGVFGQSQSSIGVLGISESFEGVHAETKSTVTAGLAAYQMNPGSRSAALFAKHHGGGAAGVFEGSVHVSGKLITSGVNLLEEIQNIKSQITQANQNPALDDLKNRIKDIETFIKDGLQLRLLTIENSIKDIYAWINAQ